MNNVLQALIKVIKLYKRVRYQFSPEKRELDDIVKQIRQIKPISNDRWIKLKQLAQKEKQIYEI